jgi:hypothetical protein
LYTLQGETGVETATSKRRVLEDHGTRAGNLAGNSKALHEAEEDKERWREHADLGVCRE